MNVIFSLIILSLFTLPTIRRKKKVYDWRKQFSIDTHDEAFKHLFENVDGFSISREGRRQQDALEYVYGEVVFIPFCALLTLVPINKTTVFYDLGSGTGKAVFICAMVYNVKKSCGIEILPTLHNMACALKDQLTQLPAYTDTANNIDFILNNFLDINIDDATLIYINATSYFGESWQAINNYLSKTKSGTVIITTSKPLVTSDFRITKETLVQMSWGVVRAFVHHRL